MKIGRYLLASAALMGFSSVASAQGYLISPNGQVQIGIVATGNLDVSGTPGGFVGIGYNFTGQGGRTGFQDALTPGCPCEGWGVAGNGAGNSVGQAFGNSGISLVSQTQTATSFTSVTTAAGSGLTVTQVFTLGTQTATGALFQDQVTITNSTGATVTGVQYGRAMDWDVPPSEFREAVTHGGVGTTASLVHSTDDGFANADPITAVTNGGLNGTPNTNGYQGIQDHGSLFVFGFGDLADGASKTFNIFYGAGIDTADAFKLLSNISPELYSIGQSTVFDPTTFGYVADPTAPTFVFAFNGVGGAVIVPPEDPTGVPAPAGLGLFGMALLGFAAVRRLRA